MTNEERARTFLVPLLAEGASCGDEEDDQELVQSLAAEFDAVEARGAEECIAALTKKMADDTKAAERARIVAWLRTLPPMQNPRMLADEIEPGGELVSGDPRK
jgi:hypothetical protein